MFALNKPFAIHLLVGKDEGTWGIAILHNICKVLTSQSNGISQKFGWPQGQADPLASAARSSRDKFPWRSHNLQCNCFLVIQILRQGRKGLGLSTCRFPNSWPVKNILPSPPLPTCASHKPSRAQQSPSGTAGHPCEQPGWQLKYHPAISTSSTGRAKGNNPRWVPSVGEQLTYGNWKGVATLRQL